MHNILESIWYGIKLVVVPQRKGDIRVKCINAVQVFEFEKNKEQLQIQVPSNAHDEDTIVSIDTEPSDRHEHHSHIHRWLNKIQMHKQCYWEEKQEIDEIEELEEDEMFISTPLDTFIGFAVNITGSMYTLFFMIALLIGWIIWGGVTGAPDVWQIVMQDGQSIQTYVWDTFLMRQQMDDNEKFLIFIGKMKSRALTHHKLLEIISSNEEYQNALQRSIDNDDSTSSGEFNIDDYIKFEKKTWFEKLCDYISKVVGSLPVVIIYWLGVFAWVGCGAVPTNVGTTDEPDYETFSNSWQMYINTTTAIILLFTSVFLENVRARTNGYILKQMQLFNKFDCELEYNERKLTNYYQEENELVSVSRCPRDKIQSYITVYSIIVGNGLGLIISTCVFIIWFAIGNLMHWNANWWLVIGTYTGLVGFIDGFVLREVYFSITNYEMAKFEELLSESRLLLDLIGIETDVSKPRRKKGLAVKVSLWINLICSNKWSVIFSVCVVIGLVCYASAMLWEETAQLVCNTPTMIVEGFFLLILIQAQDWASEDRIDILTELARSRIMLKKYVDKIRLVEDLKENLNKE